ncbi:MAG: hypothetical protein OSJ39_00645 [Clostridia bacterium]|nr:hypothetical protein [Clostridia bacterium]
MARPKIEIEKGDFEKLCNLQCTLVEIAGFFDCSEDTVERWCFRTYGEGFADIYKKKSAKCKISLRRNQFEISKTNATMAIWLGKQYLGQKDNAQEKNNENAAQPTFEFVFADTSLKEQGDGKENNP